MTSRIPWTRQQLLVAFALYCRLPFGRLYSRNPEIVRYAEAIGRSPSALAMKLTNIASLDPEIRSTGRTGLKSVSSADRQMWEEMHSDWDGFAFEVQQAIDEFSGGHANEQEKDEQADYSGEDTFVLSKNRVGQTFFRRAVLSAYNEQCCITGLTISKLLVASHIVPWRDDPQNRVNPRNGLLLSALHDKAFDAGLVTINEDLTVRVSETILESKDEFFSRSIGSYHGLPIKQPSKFRPSPDFLAYHRENVFEKSS